MNFRVGQGYDAHRFQPGDHVILGGVKIPFDKGLAAHSDGDVALHALCDALLGAAALGDIGRHFPDTDAAYKGVDSRLLLRRVRALLAEKGWRPVNVDLTIVCQAPRLAPHIPEMQANIAADLGLEAEAVNVKATTTEKMGFEGRGEGISAQAVALLAGR
ncbi:2-C-methyl-D-erythritol 2,4-cyclodiphosphate synthase [Methylomarinovum caldicuralii]|uniref:2-C-methyl-D-erythritol 2,4-cyclodiphosphate synthase n=1 Tax=Methylomarinovum caldicuralii TaxID=438856 RepID=A0AAU9CRY4_9GAMM|nr:2-C-methyl-D-erythritol 2,4-cyclodiphosphate synthase [Methylomarinovum caldicuralii]BCX82287.1 2-C-methyl-D-erythritol 2,4-cyclodiphosphate synthase [Methylomarinovum caldicuralii]